MNTGLNVTDFRFRQTNYTIQKLLSMLNFNSKTTANLHLQTIYKPESWDSDRKSLFIESILIRFPLNPIYLDATVGLWRPLDGHNRLNALKEFMIDGTHLLSSMEFYKEFEYMGYEDIPRSYQRRIEETVINVYILESGTTPELKQNVYDRIRGKQS